MILKLAFSPCPNDTFLFCALIKGWVHCPFQFEIMITDLQTLNPLAVEGVPDVCKISFASFPLCRHNYDYLSVGAALGFGNGPKLISSRQNFKVEDLAISRLVHPGRDTTAYKLYKNFLPPAGTEIILPYDQIIPCLEQKNADAGIIIHESRFTFEKQGFYEVLDLGKLWEEKIQAPLPLGGIVVKKSLGEDFKKTFSEVLRASLDFAWKNPQQVMPFVLEHSVEKNPSVVQAHIDLYVNSETSQLSANGTRAIEMLLAI